MNAYIDTLKITDENGNKSILYPRTKQEAVDGLNERLSKLEVADITETEDTTLENSHAGRLLFTEIDGEMEQGANPSPTNKQEIRNVSISGIKTHGKNLFDKDNLLQNSAVNDETGDVIYALGSKASEFISISMPFVLSGNYSQPTRITFYNKNYEFIKSVKYSSYPIYVSDVENAKFIRANGNAIDTSQIQIEEGTEATPYEPYTESSITFSQPIELGGIGNYQDVIGAKNIIRRIGKYTVTSSDLISNNGGFMTVNIPNMKAYGQSGVGLYDVLAMSNYFRSGSWGNALDESVFPYWNTSRISFKTAMTIEEFRAWVAEKETEGNPLEVYFVLATETTEELPIADQIALNSLQTFDGITYVEFISEIKPAFSAKYGTTEMGGMTLESLLTARNNDLRLSAVESAVINNI